MIQETRSKYLPTAYYDKSKWGIFCKKGSHKVCTGRRTDKSAPNGQKIQKCECPHHEVKE